MEEQITLEGGRRLGLAEYGDPSGDPVLYFHGFPGSRLDWRLFEGPAVEASGLRILAPDRPGYGLSDPRPGATTSSWVMDVIALADALDLDRFGLLGVSGGGPFALACAAQIPERLSTVAVVCGMGPPEAPGMKRGAAWTLPGKPALLRRLLLFGMKLGLEKDPEKFVAQSQAAFAGVDAALLEDPAVAEVYLAALQEALRQGTQGARAEAAALARPWPFSPEAITIPVHLWHGALDENVPQSVGRYLADLIPDCRPHFFEGEGHFSLPRNQLGEILGALVEAAT